MEMTGLAGMIDYKQIPEEQKEYTKKHGKRLDCTWVITVNPGSKVRTGKKIT
jgi:hypothetical protein